MFILLLVELLKVGGVIVFTVRGHLLPYLSLLSGLRRTEKHNTHTHTRARQHISASVILLIYTDTLKAHRVDTVVRACVRM